VSQPNSLGMKRFTPAATAASMNCFCCVRAGAPTKDTTASTPTTIRPCNTQSVPLKASSNAFESEASAWTNLALRPGKADSSLDESRETRTRSNPASANCFTTGFPSNPEAPSTATVLYAIDSLYEKV